VHLLVINCVNEYVILVLQANPRMISLQRSYCISITHFLFTEHNSFLMTVSINN